MKEGIFMARLKKFFRPINLNCFNCKLSFLQQTMDIFYRD